MNYKQVLDKVNEIRSRKKHEGAYCWFGWQLNDDYEISYVKILKYFEAFQALNIEKDSPEYNFLSNYIESMKPEKVDVFRRGSYQWELRGKLEEILEILKENNYDIYKYIKYEYVETVSFYSVRKQIPKLPLEIYNYKLKNIVPFDKNKNYIFYQDGTCIEKDYLNKFYKFKNIEFLDEDGDTDDVDVCFYFEKINEIKHDEDWEIDESTINCKNCKNNKNCEYRKALYSEIEVSNYTSKDLLDLNLNDNFYRAFNYEHFEKNAEIKVTKKYKISKIAYLEIEKELISENLEEVLNG